MTYDIVIRGGRIVDGTGRASFTGDVAVDGGRIVAIGTVGSAATDTNEEFAPFSNRRRTR